MAGSVIITIFIYKGFNKNLEIGNTPNCVFPNICGMGQVKDTKFRTNVSNAVTEFFKISMLQVLSFLSY